MSASRISVAANALYKFKRPDLLSTEGAKLPEAYKNFYREWKLTRPAPVHEIPPAAEWVRDDETGEVKRVSNVPIPVKYIPDSHKGIWGGEGVVKGFQKRHKLRTRVPHFWVPNLKRSAVYSEILDKRMEVILTERTVDLIMENYGFDHYLLKTKACDLQSSLALKLKRKMLQALHFKTLYPDDPTKRDAIYQKYKHYLEKFTEEDIEWFGLTFDEALAKHNRLEAESNKPVPLKHELRAKFIEQLMKKKEADKEAEASDSSRPSLLSKLNPFGGKS